MKTRAFVAIVVAIVLTAWLAPAEATQRGKAKGNAKNGPSFCRSGAGHPVYGRQWCIEQGFGLGEASWRRAGPGKIKFARVPEGAIQPGRLGWREVAGILTDAVLDEIFRESSYELDRERVAGEWRGGASEGLLVFELTLGGEPVAELTDLDLDGNVDVLLIAEH